MKAILRCLQAVQGQIPCTDAARRMMRGELTSLITYFGCPSLFVTFNPADVLHPFTWRRGLTTPPTPLPQVQLDQHLLCALRDANLWRMVALDPTAAVEAFHLHVNTFLSTLLKVVPSAQQLPTDGIASIDGQGIFGPLSAAFGVIEPQQRGSLHIHFLLFCYGFQDPHVLVQNFAAQLPLLEERLWAWINSIVVTSFEAIPPMFDLPRSTLENLRPLPYSDAQMKLMHPHYRPHLVAASDHWFAADPNNFLYAHDFIDCPFALDMPVQKPFVPWCLDYLATTIAPLHTDTASMLLYDLRASVLYSGLLHCCQPKTCYKGKIGKRGYCRLSFWHWLPLSFHVWERCHGIELCPAPLLGTKPPHIDAFQTERHHQFFGRMNPIILATCKCNHDISTLLRFPADYLQSPDPAALIRRRMAQNMSTLVFYVSCYTTKTQPHLASLWTLLHTATHKLQQDLGAAHAGMDHKARARSTLSKLLMSCQRRIHKSVQEMISYLLGYPEAYSTHSFHKLYFYHLAARLESSEPFDGSHLASVEAATPSSVLIFPEESIQACSDTNNHFRQPQFYTPSSDDYPFRGDDLQGWPLYFYAAGVTRIPTSKTTFKTPGNIPFLPQHPRATSLRQQVLTATAWKIPHLMGPRIPPVTEDANKRGLLLLLLFKPWVDLHQLLPSSVGCASWSEAFDTWFAGLLASLPSPSTRASPLSAEYWAQRTLHIINHIDNMGLSDPTTADRELRCNPDELHGVPDTTTVEHGPPPGQLDSDSDVSCDQTYDIDYGDLDPHDFPDEAP